MFNIKELLAVIIASSFILLDVVWADVSYYINNNGQLIQVEESVVLEKITLEEILKTSSPKEIMEKISKKVKSNSKKEINYVSLAKAVLFRESSNNYQTINKFGYFGGYQFGVAMAEDAGMLKKGEFKRFLKMKVSQKKFFFKYAKWTKGLSAKKFLATSKIQDKYFKRSLLVNLRYLKAKGVVSKNTPVHKIQGYLVAAHLKGANSVKLWVNGKLKKKTDRFGTHINEYFKLGLNS